MYFYISKCESLPRTTNFAPSFCYRLERRDVFLFTRCTLGALRDLPQTSALVVRLIFGKTKGLPMFIFPIVGRNDYDSNLCCFQPPSGHVSLAGVYPTQGLLPLMMLVGSSSNVINGYFKTL